MSRFDDLPNRIQAPIQPFTLKTVFGLAIYGGMLFLFAFVLGCLAGAK